VHERKEKEKKKSDTVLALHQRENTREEIVNARLSSARLEQSNTLENQKTIGPSPAHNLYAPIERDRPSKHLPP
jgi:hypothetical protein